MLQYIYLPLPRPLSFVLQRPAGAHSCSTTHVTFILATLRVYTYVLNLVRVDIAIDRLRASGQLHPYCEP